MKDLILEIVEAGVFCPDWHKSKREQKKQIVNDMVECILEEFEEVFRSKVHNSADELKRIRDQGYKAGQDTTYDMIAVALGRAGFKQKQVDRYTAEMKKVVKEMNANDGKLKVKQGDYQQVKTRTAKHVRKL